MVNRKIYTFFLLVILLFYVFSTGLMVLTPIVKIADAGDITSYYHNNSYLKVTTPIPSEPPPPPPPPPPPALEIKPIINWYDLQTTVRHRWPRSIPAPNRQGVREQQPHASRSALPLPPWTHRAGQPGSSGVHKHHCRFFEHSNWALLLS